MRQNKGAYLDSFGIFRDSPGGNALGTPDNLPNALCDVDWICLRLRRLFNANDEVGNHMCRNLPVRLNQGREKCKQRVESRTRNKRRMGDLIDISEKLFLNHRERDGR